MGLRRKSHPRSEKTLFRKNVLGWCLAGCLFVWLCLQTLFLPRTASEGDVQDGFGSQVSVRERRKWHDDGLIASAMTIADVKQQLRTGTIDCTGLVKTFLGRIDKINSRMNAVVEKRPLKAILQDASKRDKALHQLDHFDLFCVPVIVKDNVAVKGLKNAAGSIILERILSTSKKDAPSIANLKRRGAIILGKANMDEFALAYRSLSSRGGQTKNIFDRTRYPGGSSGGSAVAVAAGLAVLGVGTDTGGSVRIPASFASLVGIRPSGNLVPGDGVVPLSHTRDTVGFLAHTVRDVAIALDAATGQNVYAASCTAGLQSYREGAEKKKLGVLSFLFPAESSQEKLFNDVLAKLEHEFDLLRFGPGSEMEKVFGTLSKQKSTSTYEFQDDLQAYLENDEGISGWTLQRVIQSMSDDCGTRVSKAECNLLVKSISKKTRKEGKLSKKEQSAYQKLTNTLTTSLRAKVENVFSSHQLSGMLYPTFRVFPSKIKEGRQKYCGNNRLAPALLWPSLTVPVGFATTDSTRLPQGLEVLGLGNTECTLFQICSVIEELIALKRPNPDL